MLETNQKFRTIIVERRTKAGKWVFHSKVIQALPNLMKKRRTVILFAVRLSSTTG